MKTSNNKKWLLVALLLLLIVFNLTTRLLWDKWYPAKIYSDCTNYLRLAGNIAEFGVYRQNNEPEVYWPPLWPHAIALTLLVDSPLFSIDVLTFALQLLSALLIWQIARIVSPHPLIATIPLIFFALNPSHLLLSNVYVTEHLFTFLFTLFLFIVFKLRSQSIQNSRVKPAGYMESESAEREDINEITPSSKRPWRAVFWGLAAGLALGMASLTRGITLPLIALIILFAIFRIRRKELFNISLIFWITTVVIALIPIGWWTYRNYRVTGERIVVSSVGAENFWFGNNPSCFINWLPADSPFRDKYEEMQPSERYKAWQADAIQFIKAHPFVTVFGWVSKTWRLLSPEIYDTCFHIEFPQQTGVQGFFVWRAFNQLIWLVTIVGFIVFVVLHLFIPVETPALYDKGAVNLILLLILLWIVLHAITLGHPRYRYPMEHFFWMLSVLGYLKIQAVRKQLKVFPEVIQIDNDNDMG